MMIKKINILQEYIEIIEEKKGIFGIKEYVSKINVESIDKIERLTEYNKLTGILFWNKNDILHGIGFKNYKGDLEDLEDIYNRIFNIINKNSVKIIETELMESLLRLPLWPFKKKQIISSKKKYIDYLPVGTIIKLNNDNEEYMIFRYLGNACIPCRCNYRLLKKSHIYNLSKDMKNKCYHMDYAITPYPSGDETMILYIMHEDIKEIIYLGYDDEYRKNILNDIDKWNEKKGDINE